LLYLFIFCFIAILVIVVCIRLLKIDKRERGEEGDGHWGGGGGGPSDWPALPPAPRGGPTPEYVPEEWVQEVLKPRRIEIFIIKPKPEPEDT
jgi:hypothetical protein